MNWLIRLRCRMFGHITICGTPSGGHAGEKDFTIPAWCDRCHEDLTVTVPSRMVIYPRKEPS